MQEEVRQLYDSSIVFRLIDIPMSLDVDYNFYKDNQFLHP